MLCIQYTAIPTYAVNQPLQYWWRRREKGARGGGGIYVRAEYPIIRGTAVRGLSAEIARARPQRVTGSIGINHTQGRQEKGRCSPPLRTSKMACRSSSLGLE